LSKPAIIAQTLSNGASIVSSVLTVFFMNLDCFTGFSLYRNRFFFQPESGASCSAKLPGCSGTIGVIGTAGVNRSNRKWELWDDWDQWDWWDKWDNKAKIF
jgi:hypothetical protein